MGTTVTTGKKVAAFQRSDGTTIYAMFERTYEKNCHPHTDSWSCRGIGTYDQVMQYVFRSACSCEGGMLQLRSGHTKPENYIQRWREEFAKPSRMDDLEITLKLGGDSIYSTIPDSQEDFALAILAAIGRDDIANQLKLGPVTISLHGDIDVVLALYGVDTPIPAWKVIRDYWFGTVAQPDLAPSQRTGNVVPPTARVYKIDESNLVMGIDGAPLTCIGWQYNAVQTYMMDVVLDLELQCTGSSTRLIPAFRDQCAQAPMLPDDTIVTVTADATEHWYYRKEARRLAVKLGICDVPESAPATFQVTLEQAKDVDEVYCLSRLDAQQAVWFCPPPKHEPSTRAETSAPALHQQALF